MRRLSVEGFYHFINQRNSLSCSIISYLIHIKRYRILNSKLNDISFGEIKTLVETDSL